MFKEYFKKYKCKSPDLTEIYDFHDESRLKLYKEVKCFCKYYNVYIF